MENPQRVLCTTIPKIGTAFETLDDVWECWKAYGRKYGFGVRKECGHKDKKTMEVVDKLFVCYKEGRKRERSTRSTRSAIIRRRPEIRTGCMCRIKVVYDKTIAKYVVKKFEEQHNHELQPPETARMLLSQREVTKTQALAIELACDSGLTPKATQELLSREAGGRSKLGFLIEDQKTYLRSRRKRNMAHGELGSVLSYFEKEKKSDAKFSYCLQLDSEDLVTNIFWADSKMLVDYAAFGDVVTFDTTFGTNKTLRPLGVFTGFSHHRKMVIFGAALLYDETAESFQWLFETFVNTHGGKKPQTIFTDQDAAMKLALGIVWPEVYHGLCVWHLRQNGIKHLSVHMKKKSPFWKQFCKCMFEYDDKEEFEIEWKKMNKEHGLENNDWLMRMYGMRDKWANSYMKDAFTLGIRTTQLSESLNSDLKDHLKSDLNIGDFFNHFDRVVDQKREKELEAEFQMRQNIPCLGYSRSPLLKQASERYTPKFFEIFKDEFGLAESVIILNEMNAPTYIVALHENPKREFKVMCDQINGLITCSCKNFEYKGMLCCHILKVFSRLSIFEIPEKYILNRLTRLARGQPVCHEMSAEEEDVKTWTRRFQSQLLSLTYQASEYKEMRCAFEKKKEEFRKILEEFTSGKEIIAEDVEEGLEKHMAVARGLKKKESRKGKRRQKPQHETRQKKMKTNINQKNISKSRMNFIEVGGLDLNLEPSQGDLNHTFMQPVSMLETHASMKLDSHNYQAENASFDFDDRSQGWLNNYCSQLPSPQSTQNLFSP